MLNTVIGRLVGSLEGQGAIRLLLAIRPRGLRRKPPRPARPLAVAILGIARHMEIGHTQARRAPSDAYPLLLEACRRRRVSTHTPLDRASPLPPLVATSRLGACLDRRRIQVLVPSLGRRFAIARRAVAVLEAPLTALAVRPAEIGRPPAARQITRAIILLDASMALAQTDRRRPRVGPPPPSPPLMRRADPIGMAGIFAVLVYVGTRTP